MSVRVRMLAATAIVGALAAAGLVTAAVAAPTPTPSAAAKVSTLQSAGPMAFAPNGVLLIGDTAAASVVAVETGDTAKAKPGKIDIDDLAGKVAALLGTTKDQVAINDVAVNPISGSAYLSISRGLGPDAAAIILKADRAGKLTEVKVDALKHTSVSLLDAPAIDPSNPKTAAMRAQSITDLGYVNGQVLVAGLSNEEFSSSMRDASRCARQ